jgi:hypothetical protein
MANICIGLRSLSPIASAQVYDLGIGLVTFRSPDMHDQMIDEIRNE